LQKPEPRGHGADAVLPTPIHVKPILIAMLAFAVLLGSAMYFANRVLSQKDVESRSQSCSVDQVMGVEAGSPAPAHDGQQLTVRGWAADMEVGRIPSEVELVLVGGDHVSHIIGRGKAGIERADVANAYRKPDALKSGFEIQATVAVPNAGDWKLQLVELFPSRRVVCETSRVLRVAK
jgi:hypothetical protein